MPRVALRAADLQPQHARAEVQTGVAAPFTPLFRCANTICRFPAEGISTYVTQIPKDPNFENGSFSFMRKLCVW